MVRSQGRGQFRVTAVWEALPPLQRLVEEADELDPSSELALPAPAEEEGLGPGSTDEELAAPHEPEPEEMTIVPQLEPAPMLSFEPESESPRAREPEPEPPSAPRLPPLTIVTATPSEPSRTLAALLARMWLVRTAARTNGSLALPPTERPTPPSPSAPPGIGPADRPAPPRAPASFPPAPAVPPAAPPPEPIRPVPAVPSPTPPSAPAGPTLRLPLHFPDEDDRHPISGLGSFLVEVANVQRPPQGEPAPPPPVAHGGRLRLVYRIVHCPHPIPEKPPSRDSCHLWRFGRDDD